MAVPLSAPSWPEFRSPQTNEPLLRGVEAWTTASNSEKYPIVADIPRFVESDEYVENFGWQWNRFPKTQLDSHTGIPISEIRLRRCIGEDLWPRLEGMHILECGCGAGRFTEVLLKQGAFVTSVDLSNAVEANAKNCPVGPRHRIAKADILKLPFAPQKFDIVICIGVIQHTPNSEETIARLYDHVRPGGTLVIDHYTQENARWSSIKPLVRAWLKRKPPTQTLPFVESMVDRFLPWHSRFRNFYPAWFLLCRVSPIVTFYRLLPELSEPLQREWAMLDTHDSLTDWFKHLRDLPQIRSALENLGLQKIWCESGGNGVEARGQRPG